MAEGAPVSGTGATSGNPGVGDPDHPDSTLDKMACLEEMINRLEDAAPGPSDMFLRSVLAQVSKDDISTMVGMQKHMLSRFEKTNEMLLNFNALSRGRYEATHQEFRRHTQLLLEMRKDLDNVFRRIRTLKTKLNKQYPHAFNAVAASSVLEEEDDSVASPKHTARPPRPSQPPQVRPRSRTNTSNTSSPSNRHSWAGYPTKEESTKEDGTLQPTSQTDLSTTASTETLRKDSDSTSDVREDGSEDNKVTVTATIETPRRQLSEPNGAVGYDVSKPPPPQATARIVAGEADDDED